MMRPLAVGEEFEGFESNEEYSWSQGDALICSKPIISYNDFCSNGEMMELEEEEEEEEKAASLIAAAAASFIMKPTKAPSPDSVLDLQDTPPLDADRTYRSQFGWLVSSPNMVAHAGYMMVGDHYVAASHDDQYSMDDMVQTFYDCTAYNPRYASSPPSPLKLEYGSWEGEMPSTDEEPRSSSDPDTTSFSSPEDHYTTSYEIKDYEMKSDQLNQFVEAKKPKKQVSPTPIVAFRRCIKAYLDKQLQEELQASCMYQNEGEFVSFCIPELDHHHHRDCCLQIDPISAWMLQERDSRNDHGLQLVHHLFACAEAVACRDVRHARSHLRRVRELASPYGNPLQRVAACFVEGLAARLEDIAVSPATAPPIFAAAAHELSVNDMLRQEAFYLMCEVCPFVRFGHLIANSIILEAVEGEEAVHVIDLGMAEGLQWPSLIYSLANRPGGPPKLLRITGIGAYKSRMEEIGEALRREAAAVALNFEFQAVEQPLESVVAADVGLRDGEALAVNSVLKLHCVVKESRGSLNTVLQSIHRLSPKVLTLAEQDANHNGPFFLGRFTEALNYYSAIFDSLQVALPRRCSTRRVKIEQFHLAPEIRNIVACEGPTRVERHERVDQWRRRMSRAGFQPAPVRLAAQARIWLANFYPADIDNYTLSDEKGCLVLGWKGKPIIAASAWRC